MITTRPSQSGQGCDWRATTGIAIKIANIAKNTRIHATGFMM